MEHRKYINKALRFIDRHEFGRAYEMFSFFVDSFHDAQSLSNMGVFLNRFGDCLEEDISTVRRRAREFLLRANKTAENARTTLELAGICSDEEKYERSAALYGRAIEILPSGFSQMRAVYNNIGADFYMLNDFSRAAECFSKALGENPFGDGQTANIADALMFSLCRVGKYADAGAVLEKMLGERDYEISPDTVILCYITDCSAQLRGLDGELECYDLDRPEYAAAKSILFGEMSSDMQNRIRCIENYLYRPQEMFICNFYGCRKHGTSLELLTKKC